jgi:cytochrome P450
MYPHTDRILGTDFLFENLKALKEGNFLPMVQDRYRRLGVNTWQSQMLRRTYLQTSDPENVKAILATQFKEFILPRSRSTMAKVFGFGIFINNGQEWEHSRAMLRPNFNRAQVADLETLETHFKKMSARISTDGSPTDVQPLFFMLTMDSATEFLFGHSSNTLDAGASHEHGIKFSEAFTDATQHIGRLVRTPKQVRWMLDNKKYNDDTAFIHEYVSQYVDKAVNMYKNGTKRSEKYIFLEELAMTGVGAPKIQAELLNILLAGRDTTAGLLSYLFYTLPRHQKVMDRLRAEVAELEGRAPNYDEVKRMKYLSWVINEGRSFSSPFP